MDADVVLIGASARALASSVIGAGLRPIAFDLFADWDLKRLAVAERIDRPDYPRRLGNLAPRFAGLPWIYAGGLENWPEVLDELADRGGPLIGNGGPVVRRVRDPGKLYASLNDAGYCAPECRPTPEGLPTDGSWLRKPVKGSGGFGIQRWHGVGDLPESSDSYYWQRWIDGPPHSAVFLGEPRPSGHVARLLGVCRQLIGTPSRAANTFQYTGNIGAVDVGQAASRELVDLGAHLARAFALKGLFGVDFVLVDQRPWVIEVNPRYTASIEVLERCRGLDAIRMHWEACGFRWPRTPGPPSASAQDSPRGGTMICKGILYANQRCMVRPGAPCYDAPEGRFADIPHPGTVHEAGAPILTLFVDGESADACLDRLEEAARRFRADSLRTLPRPDPCLERQ